MNRKEEKRVKVVEMVQLAEARGDIGQLALLFLAECQYSRALIDYNMKFSCHSFISMGGETADINDAFKPKFLARGHPISCS